MINVNNSQTNNVFKDFPELKFGQPQISVNSNLLTDKPDTVDIKSGTVDSKNIASVNVSDVSDKKNGKKGGIVAATVGTTILTGGIVALIVTKGFSSVTYRRINDLIERLNDKIYSKKSKTYVEKGTIALAKGFKGFLSGLKAVANFNAIKDSFVNKMFRATKFTTKIADGTTNLFKKFADDAMDSAYNKVHIDTDDFCANLANHVSKLKANKNIDLTQEIEIKGVKKPINELLDDLEKYSHKMKSTFEKGFSKNARIKRDELRQQELEGLYEKVWNAIHHDNGGILNTQNANKFKTYITEDLSLKGKIKLKSEIVSHRKAFTNNVKHNYSLVKTSLQEISGKLKVDDSKSRELLKDISKKLEEYRAFTGTNESGNRKALAEELIKDLKNFSSKVSDSDKNYSDKVKEAIDAEIKFISDDVLKIDNKGAVQEIMTIVKYLSRADVKNKNGETVKLIDEKLAKNIDKKSHSITASINKATNMESEDLYDKSAEFKVGSAPSDLLGLIAPVGIAAYAISKGDDKNERISTTLTTGIPIIGTIGTMIFGTIRMLAGSKNLGLAVGVGFVLNFVGNACDKLYKDYKEKRSFTQMALDAYKNNPMFSPLNKK